MKNVIVAAAAAAISVSASAQNFPFNSFDGQVDNMPYNGSVETNEIDPYGIPMTVQFLDVDGDGRFDYMGQGTTVVDLDGYHDSLEWREMTNVVPYSTAQEGAFDSAIGIANLPPAKPGLTGSWNAMGKFEYLSEAEVIKNKWKTPELSWPDGLSCEGAPPVLCKNMELDAESLDCVLEQYYKWRRDQGLPSVGRGCGIVIFDQNNRLRLREGAQDIQEGLACSIFHKNYNVGVWCPGSSTTKPELPLEYKDSGGR